MGSSLASNLTSLRRTSPSHRIPPRDLTRHLAWRRPRAHLPNLSRAFGDRYAALLSAYRGVGLTISMPTQHTELSVLHLGRLIGSEQVKCKT
jgi:hypothetical protein